MGNIVGPNPIDDNIYRQRRIHTTAVLLYVGRSVTFYRWDRLFWRRAGSGGSLASFFVGRAHNRNRNVTVARRFQLSWLTYWPERKNNNNNKKKRNERKKKKTHLVRHLYLNEQLWSCTPLSSFTTWIIFVSRSSPFPRTPLMCVRGLDLRTYVLLLSLLPWQLSLLRLRLRPTLLGAGETF